MKFMLLATFVFTLSSCALRHIVSEYNYEKNNISNVELEKLGNGLILIYNGADGLHKIDNTARLNVWISKKPMGQVNANEYAIIELENGDYEFEIIHVDMFKFKSTHKVTISESTKVIRIEPTITSNKLTITNQLPKKFERFEYAEKEE